MTHHQPSVHLALKQYWGYDNFRPLQEEIIQSVLEGTDTLALMPTGGGKSLCYQVPAMVKPGLCLVISPLIALMKDQVENLRRKGITAYTLVSGMSRKDTEQTLRIAGNSNCKFLYVSPERLETRLFKEYLPSLPISLIAVDEAHCISQWGYDFRPPYLRIALLREELKDVPVLALTASATGEVQDDICLYLGFKKKTIFRQSFERPNLSYSVFKVEARLPKVKEILEKVQGTGIIYCSSRKLTQEISSQVKKMGFSADYYHAGLSGDERARRQEAWVKDEIRIMVCTNAFGMGIDKPNVRVVIHTDIPDCLENYYQEAGRAGRDGKKAYAVLLYDDRSITNLSEQASIRFPTIGEISKIYESIGNYFQLPSGTGEGQTFDLDINDLIRKFELPARKLIPALGVLAQDEWLTYNDQVFNPPTVQFTCNKETIYQFENDHPGLEPLIKALLRSYEGIWGYPVNISEFLLVKLLKRDVMEIVEGLKALHRYGIIVYTPQKDKPQIKFLRNRVRTDQLKIDIERYNKQEKRFRERLEEMKRFINTTQCRSRFIGEYFGDKEMKECGICDNCLKKKERPITAEDIQVFYDLLKEMLYKNPAQVKEIQARFGELNKDRFVEMIKFLQSEGKIVVNQKGEMKLSL